MYSHTETFSNILSLWKFKLSYKRFKQYRLVQNIEQYPPFKSKKNVKFLKRNRFINFLYDYVITIRRLLSNKKNSLAKTRELMDLYFFFIRIRLNQLWYQFMFYMNTNFKLSFTRLQYKRFLCSYLYKYIHSLSINYRKFKSYFIRRFKRGFKYLDFNFKLDKYSHSLLFKLLLFYKFKKYYYYSSKRKIRSLYNYYNNLITEKEQFYLEYFPDELISAHRKRRIQTYVKRIITFTNRKVPKYFIFKRDVLYIMTSRSRKVERTFTELDQVTHNKFIMNFYNISFYKMLKPVYKLYNEFHSSYLSVFEYFFYRENKLSFFFFKIGLFFNFTKAYSYFLNNRLFLNFSNIINPDYLVLPGDIISFTHLNFFLDVRFFNSLRFFFFFLSTWKISKFLYLKKHVFLKLYKLLFSLFSTFLFSQLYYYNIYKIRLNLCLTDVNSLFVFLIQLTFNLNFFCLFSNKTNSLLIYHLGGLLLPSSNINNPYITTSYPSFGYTLHKTVYTYSKQRTWGSKLFS